MLNKAWVRLIGDVHGKYDKYLPLTKGAEYSLCVGDIGFNYSYLTRHLNPEKHKIIGGNHDCYNTADCPNCNKSGCDNCEGRGYVFSDLSQHFLKDYGVYQIPEFDPIFYVRGAWSIDQAWRHSGISWWKDEELTYQQCDNAICKYQELKPSFMVTHTVPQSIIPYIPFGKIFGDKIYNNRTEQMLDNMYEYHQPVHWVFGHWHVDWRKWIEHPKTGKKTEFICLKELGHADFEKKMPDF